MVYSHHRNALQGFQVPDDVQNPSLALARNDDLLERRVTRQELDPRSHDLSFGGEHGIDDALFRARLIWHQQSYGPPHFTSPSRHSARGGPLESPESVQRRKS